MNQVKVCRPNLQLLKLPTSRLEYELAVTILDLMKSKIVPIVLFHDFRLCCTGCKNIFLIDLFCFKLINWSNIPSCITK